MIAAGSFGLIAYLVGNAVFANYLLIFAVPGSGELAVFCAALIGAGLGFLWYNAPPAMVFMGDTGALSMGGALGGVSLVTKHELVLAIIGGLFVLETVSVIVQVASFKLTGRRVFRIVAQRFQEATHAVIVLAGTDQDGDDQVALNVLAEIVVTLRFRRHANCCARPG